MILAVATTAAAGAPITFATDLVVLGSAVVGFSTALVVALHAGRQTPVQVHLNGVYATLQHKLAGVEHELRVVTAELASAQARIQGLEADLSVIETACPFRVLAARKGLRTIGQLYAPSQAPSAPPAAPAVPPPAASKEDQYDADYP